MHKTSLIISTYNWPKALEACLLSILEQSKKPDEIIIADDGSSKDTEEVIMKFKTSTIIPIHHIWQKDNGFQLALIRNKAILKASNEYIIQIDGDVILHPNFIKDHVNSAKEKHFIRASRVRLGKKTSDKILTKKKKTNILLINPDTQSKFNGIRSSIISKITSKKDDSPHKMLGCNMSYWKKDAIKINGYENNMIGWGHEDEEFAARLINIGCSKIKLKNLAIVYHIFHIERKQENEENHRALIKKVLQEKITKANNGILEL